MNFSIKYYLGFVLGSLFLMRGGSYAHAANPFVIKVNTTITGEQVDLGVQHGTISNIYRGDGSSPSTGSTHTFAEVGSYEVEIMGSNLHLHLPRSVHDVIQRGDVDWNNMEYMFLNNTNINKFTATDRPFLDNVTNMNWMFKGASKFNTDISNWDVSQVENMHGVFKEAHQFNQDISARNVKNVSDMVDMFEDADSFDQDISNRCVPLILQKPLNFDKNSGFAGDTDRQPQRGGCADYQAGDDEFIIKIITTQPNQLIDLGHQAGVITTVYRGDETALTQDTSHIFAEVGEYIVVIDGTNLHFELPNEVHDVIQRGDINRSSTKRMFSNNSNIRSFSAKDVPNLTNVTDMGRMFEGASKFNDSINHWNVSNVVNMHSMFDGATNFNKTLNAWNVSKVEDMRSMFENARNFRQDISNRCVSLINSKPLDFDARAGFEGQTSRQPQWGSCKGNNYNADEFVIEIRLPSAGYTVDLGLQAGTIISVDRGDGTINSQTKHRYDAPGSYRIVIKGRGLHLKLPSIVYDVIHRGNIDRSSMQGMFENNLNIRRFSAIDIPNLSNVRDVSYMFYKASRFNYDLSTRCFPRIARKPTGFDIGAGFEGMHNLHPQWGNCSSINTSQCRINRARYNDEMNLAYYFACNLQITTIQTIDSANVYGQVTRGAFAKMISNYAKHVLGVSPNTGKRCYFSDLDEVNPEIAGYIVTSCQYDIMGINMADERFLPHRAITRGEIATIISRLHGWATDGVPTYYIPHMTALLNRGYITVNQPKVIESRGYIFIILHRVASGIDPRYTTEYMAALMNM